MATYLALLRGINVSGQKKIKMSELKVHFEDLNLSHVRTYIQSGNVVFRDNIHYAENLVDLIRKKIQSVYGFDVAVMILNGGDLKKIIDKNPFLRDAEKESSFFHVTFLAEKPAAENIEKLKKIDHHPEQYILEDKHIYFYAPNGYGRAKMNNNFFENILKVPATTRNWNSVNKLLALMTE